MTDVLGALYVFHPYLERHQNMINILQLFQMAMVLKPQKCAHSSTYLTGIFFYVLSALYVFRPFLQRHARSAVFFLPCWL